MADLHFILTVILTKKYVAKTLSLSDYLLTNLYCMAHFVVFAVQ